MRDRPPARKTLERADALALGSRIDGVKVLRARLGANGHATHSFGSSMWVALCMEVMT